MSPDPERSEAVPRAKKKTRQRPATASGKAGAVSEKKPKAKVEDSEAVSEEKTKGQGRRVRG